MSNVTTNHPAAVGGCVACRYGKECMQTLIRVQPSIPVSYIFMPDRHYGRGMLLPLTPEDTKLIDSYCYDGVPIKVSGHLRGVSILTERARGTDDIETFVRFMVVDDDGKSVKRHEFVNGYPTWYADKEKTTSPEEALRNHKKWEDEAVRLTEGFRKSA